MKIILHSRQNVTPKNVRADAHWFERHPERRWRLRGMIPGEAGRLPDPPEPGYVSYAVIERAPTGALVRRFVSLQCSPEAIRLAKADDELIKLMFVSWVVSTTDGVGIIDVLPGTPLAARVQELRGEITDDDEFAEQAVHAACPFSLELRKIVMAEARP